MSAGSFCRSPSIGTITPPGRGRNQPPWRPSDRSSAEGGRASGMIVGREAGQPWNVSSRLPSSTTMISKVCAELVETLAGARR